MALRYVLRSFTESPWIAASTVLLVMGGASALVQSASKDGYEKEQKQRWSLTKSMHKHETQRNACAGGEEAKREQNWELIGWRAALCARSALLARSLALSSCPAVPLSLRQLQRDPRVGIVPRNQVADSSAPVRRSSPAQDAESLAAQHEKTQKEYMELRKAATGGK